MTDPTPRTIYRGQKLDGEWVETDTPSLHTVGGPTLTFHVERRLLRAEPDGLTTLYLGRWLQ